MSLRSVVAAWNEFFFAPQSPIPISLFRIFYGSLVIANLILLRPDWLAWYGAHAWVSLPTMLKVEPGTRLNLFTLIPQNDSWIEALFWVFFGSAVLLTVGFLTRFNTIIVFLCLASIQQRNLFITHGGDTFLRVCGFFLIFAPAGAAFSIDRFIRIRRGKESAEIRPTRPWAQRMIQFELAVVYFAAFLWKSTGVPWVNGTALYFINHLNELSRFPVPSWFQYPMVMRLGSWLTLAVEFSLGVLVWFKEIRYFVLLVGLVMHLFLEYWINIPLFQWEILSAYVLFIDPVDLKRAGNWTRRVLSSVIHRKLAQSRASLPRMEG
jgi:Vitamin K-dependent gamma-carboxylase